VTRRSLSHWACASHSKRSLERGCDVFRQSVEVFAQLDLARVLAELAFRPLNVELGELCDRLSGASDDDLFATLDLREQLGQMCLRFMNIDGLAGQGLSLV